MTESQPRSGWRASLKTLHDKTFAGLDRVGAQVNKASGKVGVEGFWPGPMVGEIQKASRILRTFTSDEILDAAIATPNDAKKTQKVLVKIPPHLIRNAQGLAIFTMFRTGLGFSAASGSGVVISRDREGTWGPPSGILVHTLGFGFLAGADIYDVVLILRNRRAVKAFTNPKVSLGAELSVAAGPLGAGAVVDTGIEASPVLSYVKSKGLYGGAQVDGNIIIERKDENARFYGRPIKASEILAEDSRVEVPPGSEILHIAIASAEGWVSSAEERRNSEERRLEEQVRRRMSGARAAERFDLRADREEEDALMQRNTGTGTSVEVEGSSVDGGHQYQYEREEEEKKKGYKVDEADEYDGMETIKLTNATSDSPSLSPSPRASAIPPIPERRASSLSPSPRASSESTRSGPPPPLPARRRPVGDVSQ